MKAFLFPILFLLSSPVFSQTYVTRDIKSFGAKGDGRTNDHDAFQKAAAFFNARGGHGKLVIPAGVYLVGKQTFNRNTVSKPVYDGSDVLLFSGVDNVIIEGQGGAVMKFMNNLRFGAFSPVNGTAYKEGGNNFTKRHFLAFAGSMLFISNSTNIQIHNLELNGNSDNLILGGVYGDVGIQAPHTGIYIVNSKKITVDNIRAHHFGLDGIQLVNSSGDKKEPDGILIKNSSFEYNARQGFSWVGGNDLTVINSKFNHTGKGKFSSPPSAGVDIEAEVGPIRNGKFIGCEFINNTGVGLIADNGPSSNCTFTDCTFWGVTTWSIWISRPSFTIVNSKIYGSTVHGYNANNDIEATKFIKCHFEDKPYNGHQPYGRFLIETNNARRMRFENCTMVANKSKLAWIGGKQEYFPAEKYKLLDCHFVFLGGEYPAENWLAVIGGAQIKNSTFEIKHPKGSQFYISGLEGRTNTNLGGNRYIINNVVRKF